MVDGGDRAQARAQHGQERTILQKAEQDIKARRCHWYMRNLESYGDNKRPMPNYRSLSKSLQAAAYRVGRKACSGNGGNGGNTHSQSFSHMPATAWDAIE